MLDTFPVRHYFSTARKQILRASIFVAFGAILAFNFFTTCTPYFSATFEGNCNNAIIPVGTQLPYDMYSMITRSLIDYDGFNVTGCSLKDVIIQEWFLTIAAPTFRIKMDMTCDRGVSLTVNDITFKFWHKYYRDMTQNAALFRDFPGFLPAGPYEAMEYKWGWDDSKDPTLDNLIRLFTKNATAHISPNDARLSKRFFEDTMRFALEDVQGKPIPGVTYLCSQCARKADWLTQTLSLGWTLFYNTLNTSMSFYTGIIFLLALFEKDKFIEIYERLILAKVDVKERLLS